jgi:hypothetical protein
MKKRRKISLDLGPMQTVEDLQEALRILARACCAGEGGDQLVRAGEVIEQMLRFKFLRSSGSSGRSVRIESGTDACADELIAPSMGPVAGLATIAVAGQCGEVGPLNK